jgi:hypothetical protein
VIDTPLLSLNSVLESVVTRTPATVKLGAATAVAGP